MRNVILIIIITTIIAGGYWIFNQDALTSDRAEVTTGTPTQTISSDAQTPTAFDENWMTYTNDDFGISFPYPPEYELTERPADAVSEYYIALQSPLDPNKPARETTVGENELKIEIIIEDSVVDDSTETCVEDHLESDTIVSQEEVTIADTETTSYLWEGIGTGIFTCVIKNDYRYLINKYPEVSSRESYYDYFMETLTIREL